MGFAALRFILLRPKSSVLHTSNYLVIYVLHEFHVYLCFVKNVEDYLLNAAPCFHRETFMLSTNTIAVMFKKKYYLRGQAWDKKLIPSCKEKGHQALSLYLRS